MEQENLRRWRLVLGDASKQAGSGSGALEGTGFELSAVDQRIDQALAGVYDSTLRSGGRGASRPSLHRWLGDIREFFPNTVVQMMQKDAIDRLGITSLLTEKEMLETIVPDVHLVASLMSLGRAIPEKSKETARMVVRKVVDELTKKLDAPMQQAVTGALSRSVRKYNPRYKEIDWPATILKNLKNYQKEYKTIIPEVRVGMGRKGRSLKDIILCIDQSGSMGPSVVYSSIFGAVLASIPAVSTRMVFFDTAVVDMTEELQDPVDVLFGVQLGGGTDINKALTYCQQHVTRPEDTVMVVITDLYEGGTTEAMHKRFVDLKNSGVTVVVLLALSDEGAPFYYKQSAEFLASQGIPCFACTPDIFPDLMAAAIKKQDLSAWESQNITHTDKQL